MQRIKSYTINLTRLGADGEVRCPKCGVEISPDDETENVYTILETATKRNSLAKITLQCNRCRSLINLVGFSFLEKTSARVCLNKYK